mgnify:CR=1 FL=1
MLTLRNSGSDADRGNSLSRAPGSSPENQAIDLVHPSQAVLEQIVQRLYAAISVHPHHSDHTANRSRRRGLFAVSVNLALESSINEARSRVLKIIVSEIGRM